jgi:hypothetical protein
MVHESVKYKRIVNLLVTIKHYYMRFEVLMISWNENRIASRPMGDHGP